MGCLYKRKQKLPSGEYRELPIVWIKYYQNGRAVRESTGTPKETVARRILRSREGDVEHGIPITPNIGRVTSTAGVPHDVGSCRGCSSGRSARVASGNEAAGA